MKALTVSQPYASLISDGSKFVENRTWQINYRGPIAIHAGLGSKYLTKTELARYPTGVVLAIADIAACVHLDEINIRAHSSSESRRIPGTDKTWFSAHMHAHTEGPWCWILENVRQIEPVRATGKQGLWEWKQPEVQTVLF